MIEIEIPGRDPLRLKRIVLDFNGTMAIDGTLITGVRERLKHLAECIDIQVITADTFGTAAAALKDAPVTLTILGKEHQAEAKAALVRSLGPSQTAALGNGANDEQMLRTAALGIALIQAEGASAAALRASDLVFLHINDALDALRQPARLTASLRT